MFSLIGLLAAEACYAAREGRLPAFGNPDDSIT